MRIVTLLENTSSHRELACEHGLSLYIEVGGKRILFDAGQSAQFSGNAKALGVDLSAVDMAILSHGHYDHSGGIVYFLSKNTSAPVYGSPHLFDPFFNASGRNIGADPALADCHRLIRVERPTVIDKGISLYPASVLPCPYPVESWGLETERDGIRIAEDFRHEQYLLIEEAGKRILFSGCSHKGILNIMDHFRPDILIGGFHLAKQEDAGELTRIAQLLAQYPTVYYTGHCTGQKQFAHMKQILGSRLQTFSTGTVLTVAPNGDIITL